MNLVEIIKAWWISMPVEEQFFCGFMIVDICMVLVCFAGFAFIEDVFRDHKKDAK